MPLCYRRIAPLLLLILVFTTTAANAVTRTVEIDGSGEFTVIQDALVASAEGDTVLVGPGHYTWTNQGSGNEHGLVRYWQREQDGVRLISSDGPEATIIDAEGMGRVFFANGSNIVQDPVNILVQGFTLRNGYATKVINRDEQEGGAIAMHLCHGTFINCIIEDSVAEFGGGVWLGGVGIYNFENCQFRGNRAERLKPEVFQNVFGGGVMVFGPAGEPNRTAARFEGCSFIGNHSDYRAGGILAGNNTIEIVDCMFADNTCNESGRRNGTAIYAFNPGDLLIDGVTVRNHESAPGAAVYLLEWVPPDWTGGPVPTKVQIRNTLIAKGVNGTGLMVSSDNIDNLDVSCTNIYGGFPGNWVGQLLPFRGVAGNLQVDPAFCSQWGDRRMVSSNSLMLAEHNSCGEDIGRVISGDCITVPVLASGLRAWREGSRAILSWQGVDPLEAGLAVERSTGGVSERLALAGAISSDAGSIRFVDTDAPRSDVEYRLLDRSGDLLARAELPSLSGGLRLLGASPNPFNPKTAISFEIDQTARVRLDLYDARGRHVRSILDEVRAPGAHTHPLVASDLGSGVYHLRLSSAGQVRTESIVLVR